MSKLEVISGFVQNVGVAANRWGFSFDLGRPAASISMRGIVGVLPFDSGEYITVAVLAPGASGRPLSALAYRRVGQHVSARIANPLFYILGAGFGLLGFAIIALLAFVPDSSTGYTPPAWVVSLLFAGVGTYCAYRLRLMLAAKKLLDDWQPPS